MYKHALTSYIVTSITHVNHMYTCTKQITTCTCTCSTTCTCSNNYMYMYNMYILHVQICTNICILHAIICASHVIIYI